MDRSGTYLRLQAVFEVSLSRTEDLSHHYHTYRYIRRIYDPHEQGRRDQEIEYSHTETRFLAYILY